MAFQGGSSRCIWQIKLRKLSPWRSYKPNEAQGRGRTGIMQLARCYGDSLNLILASPRVIPLVGAASTFLASLGRAPLIKIGKLHRERTGQPTRPFTSSNFSPFPLFRNVASRDDEKAPRASTMGWRNDEE